MTNPLQKLATWREIFCLKIHIYSKDMEKSLLSKCLTWSYENNKSYYLNFKHLLSVKKAYKAYIVFLCLKSM